jgi:hypothetical protein
MPWQCSCGFEAGDYDVICQKCGAARPGSEQSTAKGGQSQTGQFDPRTEVSADAKYIASKIVTHLWVLFVLLPLIVGLLLALVGVIKF